MYRKLWPPQFSIRSWAYLRAQVAGSCPLLLAALFCFSALLAGSDSVLNGRAGILVMAHGGDTEWNAAVQKAVAPLRSDCPLEVAFGMAQPEPLQRSIAKLEKQGVTRIAVVRLFVSAASFRQQTEYLLGLSKAPPPVFIQHSPHLHETAAHPASVQMLPGPSAPPPVRHRSALALSLQGLYDAEEMGAVIAERIIALSDPSHPESVLILAHGDGDDALDQQWIERLKHLAESYSGIRSFGEVAVETLREDWKDKRAEAERRIRRRVQRRNQLGDRVIVVPFRVHGFGPFGQVLRDLEYVSDGIGLLPHPAVTDWVRRQASDCFHRIGGKNPLRDSGVESGVSGNTP